ncbi:hypothetical protein [Mammaliicoccus sciuri]|uniref:hypothetical protein n=1 Tax=Mammaliicoccus sciuri TaxID=1296 RepID=UPI000D1D5F88|nr:hypothetical protein [Mammaliicoccus sciuri]PTJ44823.1 hypothetical protein BUZ98_09090 [Mammaliicoccus sciuri]PTJ61273.1 hypothetical protein BUZ97_13225 [Mammaliicoccus sciuri]RIN99705.1 hypothetical protein BUZ99_13125 [Mammaliicoccus sciuri]
MKVGLLREKHKKGVLGRTLTYISNFYNIDFFVFTYDDVDLENETIDGLFFEDGQWVKKRTEFPDTVDNVPMDKRKYPEISECRQSLRLCRHFFMRMLSTRMFSACSLRIMLFPQESALKNTKN